MGKSLKETKQEKLVEEILLKIGNYENILDVYNCATRMRFTLANQELANIKDIKKIIGVKGALWANGELQIIIGQEVPILTNILKEKISNQNGVNKNKQNSSGFETKKNNFVGKQQVPRWRRFLKAVSAIFGPLIPFLVGVGLIMALQQLLIRSGAAHDPTVAGAVFGVDYNIFDVVLNVAAQTGFKLMGVIALWSTVRYLGGKTPIAIALGLIMVSPILPSDGIKIFTIGNLDIMAKPFYSTILVFIVMGIIIAQAQKWMDKKFNPVANFILNPFLSLFIGALLAFFVMGPIMGFVEKWMLDAFDWFMTLPFGIGTLIVGLTWQPLVVLGVHNVLFFAAVADLTTNGNPSLFLAAAFAAAWAQLGAAIGVGLRNKKMVDKSIAFSAALPGIISGPTESVIYGVNLPRVTPFITGIIAGGIGGWVSGMIGLRLDSLAGLGGIVGFLAYSGDDLWKALIVDIASFALGIVITYAFYTEQKSEKQIATKITKSFFKKEFISSDVDFDFKELNSLALKAKFKFWDKKSKIDVINFIEENKDELQKFEPNMKSIFKDIDSNSKLTFTQLNQIFIKTKNVKSNRQEKIRNICLNIQKDVIKLKEIEPNTKYLSKWVIKKENLVYKLNKINEKLENKNAELFNKVQKLTESGIQKNINKANELEKQMNITDPKVLQKISNLEVEISKCDENIKLENEKILAITKDIYSNIESKITQIEMIKDTDLSYIKNEYHDGIYQTVID